MDSYRGIDGTPVSLGEDLPDIGPGQEEPPPRPVGQNERRLQLRAYDLWTSLLGSHSVAPVAGFCPADLRDFGPFSVMIDFTGGADNPKIAFLGDRLAEESGGGAGIAMLADVPQGTLLARITDQYQQILSSKSPAGFEAEFINHDGKTVVYRGILLPFSSDARTVDYIYGVVNWKELAESRIIEGLRKEIGFGHLASPARAHRAELLIDWADCPIDLPGNSPPETTD